MLKDLYIYCYNRFIAKTHVIRTNCAKGQWMEWEERMFHACFNILVDFVECDLPGMDRDSDGTTLHRNPSAGIRALIWQCELKQDEGFFGFDPRHIADAVANGSFGKPTPQADMAQKILDLYTWYKGDYPAMVSNRENNSMTFASEEAFEREIDTKLRELVEIRRNLWC